MKSLLSVLPNLSQGAPDSPAARPTANGALDVDETWTYTCTRVVAEDDPDPLANTATASGWSRILGGTSVQVTSTDDHLVDVLAPGIHIEKTGPTQAHTGDQITYSLAVTLDGDTPLHDITVTDPGCDLGPILVTRSGGDQDDVLEAGETWTYTCTHLSAAADADPLPNTATAAGTDPLGRTVTDTDDHLVDVLHPAISISKTASPASAAPGTTINYTYVVTNTGDVTLHDVAVVDDTLGLVGEAASLAPGESATFTATDVLGTGILVNVATATGADGLGLEVQATDEARVTAVLGGGFGGQGKPAPAVGGTGILPGTGGPLPTGAALAGGLAVAGGRWTRAAARNPNRPPRAGARSSSGLRRRRRPMRGR